MTDNLLTSLLIGAGVWIMASVVTAVWWFHFLGGTNRDRE